MSKDEIRKLVSGYATGTLTQAEQTLLFEAALDDQELFDELAREQDLRDILDQPGAKQRLIAALEPAALEPENVPSESRAPASSERIAWWKRRWSWAAAGVTATILMLLFLTGPNPEPPGPAGSQPTEVAQNRVPSPDTGPMRPGQTQPGQTQPGQVQPAPPPPGVASPPSASGDVAAGSKARTSSNSNSQSPSNTPPGSSSASAAKPPSPANEARQKKSQVESASSGSAGVSAASAVGGSVPSGATDGASGSSASAAAPTPNVARVSPAPAPATQSAASSISPAAPPRPPEEASAQNTAAASSFAANSNAPVPAQRAAKTMAPMVARAPVAMAKAQSPARFAFEYRIESGRLTIRPAANGFLRVTAATAQGSTPIFPESGDGQVRAGAALDVAIPDTATSLDVVFTARPPERSIQTLNDQLEPDARPSSGTVEDPNPSPDSRIQIRVRVKP